MRDHLLSTLTITALLLSGSALADTVTVVHPGLSCASPEALARLTLHDGSSLVDGAYATAQAMQTATSGGCTHLHLGQTLNATSIRKNTTIVMVDTGDGNGMRAFYLPNIDVKVTRTVAPTGSLTPDAPAGAAASTKTYNTELSATGPTLAAAAAKPGPTSPTPTSGGVPPPARLALDGIRLGESYDNVHAQLHPDYFIKHVPMNDPGIKMLVAQKLEFDGYLVVQTEDDKVVAIQRMRNYSNTRPMDSQPIVNELFSEFGTLIGSTDRSTGTFGWHYDLAGQLPDPHSYDYCTGYGVQRLDVPTTDAADGPDVSSVDIQLGAASACHMTADAVVSAIPRMTVNSDSLAVRDMDAIKRYALAHKDQQIGGLPPRPMSAINIDERPTTVLPAATRTYSAGGATLGEDEEVLKARMTSAYKRYGDDTNAHEQHFFTLVRADGMDRLMIQSLNGKVTTITHDQRFANGKQPRQSAVLALAQSSFGSQATDVQDAPQTEINWSIGTNGQHLKSNACVDFQGAIVMPPIGDDARSGPPFNLPWVLFSHSKPGCKFLFSVRQFEDQSDPHLLIGLRTVLLDMGAIESFNEHRAQAAADAQAVKEKAASQTDTGL